MARKHLDALLESAIKNAVRLLERNGEFYPFGLGMCPDGETALVYPNMQEDYPSADQVIRETIRGLAAAVRRGQYIATGVVSDARLRDGVTGAYRDAVRVDLEDIESSPVTCYLLYSREGSNVKPGSIQAEAGHSVVFSGMR